MLIHYYTNIMTHCLQEIKVLLECIIHYTNNLFNSIRKYVQSCHTCHKRSTKDPGYKSYHTRVQYDFRPMSRISAHIKWRPLSNQGFNHISFAGCKISNYVIGIPIQKPNAVTIAEAILNRVVQVGPT